MQKLKLWLGDKLDQLRAALLRFLLASDIAFLKKQWEDSYTALQAAGEDNSAALAKYHTAVGAYWYLRAITDKDG